MAQILQPFPSPEEAEREVAKWLRYEGIDDSLPLLLENGYVPQ